MDLSSQEPSVDNGWRDLGYANGWRQQPPELTDPEYNFKRFWVSSSGTIEVWCDQNKKVYYVIDGS